MVALRQRGWIVVAGLLLSPPPAAAQGAGEQRFQLRDELLATDKAAGDSAMRHGLAAALASIAEPDLILLYPGAPVVRGADAVQQLLAAQNALRGLTLRWAPLGGEVSTDGDFGVTYGVMAVASDPGSSTTPLRMAKYLAAWRRSSAGWRLVARSEVGLLPGGAYILPPDFEAPTLPPLPRSGGVAAFARADAAFAARAGKVGAPVAFADFAAEDAVTFAGSGELVRGPAAIKHWLTGPEADWEWHPVTGGASARGDLGFTVGESFITPRGEEPSYGKYLTLWRRDAKGRIRFIGDGGSERPAP